MKLSKTKFFLGLILTAGLFFTACSNVSSDSGSDSSEDENPAAAPASPASPAKPDQGQKAADSGDENISTFSIPSLVSRELYYNVYTDQVTSHETEHWYYDSTNALTNYTVTTFKDLTNCSGPCSSFTIETIYAFSRDPHFADSRTGNRNMYDTEAFVTAYNPESEASYVGKYIYKYDSSGNCYEGAYVEKSGNVLGCFNAFYGPYGYMAFVEAEHGTYEVKTNNGNTDTPMITPDYNSVSEFRLCYYNNAKGVYELEAFYSGKPDSITSLDSFFSNIQTSSDNILEYILKSIDSSLSANDYTSISSNTAYDNVDSNLIALYSCKYDEHDLPVLEALWSKRNLSEAPEGASVESGSTAPDVTRIIYEFDTINYPVNASLPNYVISLQKSYRYDAADPSNPDSLYLPIAKVTKTDGSEYSTDGELSILSRQYDSYARKTRETENSYGNKIKTIVNQYDEGSMDENGLASETTYGSNDLLLSRSNYNLLETSYEDSANIDSGDFEEYETLNYEYASSRGYKGLRNVWGITLKTPKTVHWCDR